MTRETAQRPGPFSNALTYIPELDGLRAVAVLCVLLHHLCFRWLPDRQPFQLMAEYGWIGVDIFFVLSGFLITRILLRSKPGFSALKTFYFKRALRIWPLYFALLAVVCIQARVLHSHYPWKISLVLFQNFLPEFPNNGFNQTWSLCVEEHFYFIWPLLVLFGPRRVLPWVLGAVLIASPLLRAAAIANGVAPKLVYTATQYRLDAIALGSLLAFAVVTGFASYQRLSRIALFVLPLGAAASLVDIYIHPYQHSQYSASVYSFLAMTAAATVCIALSPTKTIFHRALSAKPMLYVGKISYGLYMIHPLVISIVYKTKLGLFTGMTVAAMVSFGAAALSWHFFESRLLAFGKNRERSEISQPQPRETIYPQTVEVPSA